jgi:hypothetical protein
MADDERRRAPRATVPLDGEWHGASGQRAGRIGDISLGGCFVESMAMPSVGEEVSLRLTLPGGQSLDALAEVAYVSQGMGFGVRFLGLTPEQQEQLAEAMRRLLG